MIRLFPAVKADIKHIRLLQAEDKIAISIFGMDKAGDSNFPVESRYIFQSFSSPVILNFRIINRILFL